MSPESINCEKDDCDRDAKVRLKFEPEFQIDPLPVCRHHAGSEIRHHPTIETIPLGGEGE